MVRLRVTVTVLPEDVYLATQDAHLAPGARSVQARRFMVVCESPEAWTIGQFANKIKDTYSKTYKGEELGSIKYIKDEDDADLHTDLSVYDALVDAGHEAIHKSDQRAKVTIIQEQGFPLRGASVAPDLSTPPYQVPRPRPPPPLFPTSSQAQSSARKRSRDVALGEDGSSAHSPRTRPNQRPRLASISGDHGEYIPMESVELATLERDNHILNCRREASVELTHDPQFPTSQMAANVGHDTADHWTPADVEPKSESPDSLAPLQHLKQTPKFSLEVGESAAAPIQTLPKPTSSTRFDKQGDVLLERCENLTPRQIPLDCAPVPLSTSSSAGQRASTLAKVSVPKGFQDSPNANAPLQQQARLRTWYNQPALITPPSDVSPTDTRGRFAHPAPMSAASSIIAISASNKFKPTHPRPKIFEPESSIEDSQMSPRSKKKSTPRADTEGVLTTKGRSGSWPMPEVRKAKVPSSEIARLCKRDAPAIARKRARNEPVYNFSETQSFVGDADDHQPQSYQEIAHLELEHAATIDDAIHNEESTDPSVADGQVKNEDLSKISSKSDSFEYRRSRPAVSDDQSTHPSRERSGSIDQTESDSNKENHYNGGNRRQSGVQGHEPEVDAEMVDASSGDDVQSSILGSRRVKELFQGVEISTGNVEAPMDSRSKHQSTIDILNGGASSGDDVDASGNSNKNRRNFRAAVRRSIEAQENASIGTDSQPKQRRRKKKSHADDSSSHVETGIGLAGSDIGSDKPSNDIADSRRIVLGDAQHKSNYATARSEIETLSSAESAGDQLRESLQAFTQENTQGIKVTTSHHGDSRFPTQSTAKVDARPIKNKVYEGVVRANEGASAVVELQGVKGNPCGLLHRNGASLTPFRGSIAQILSLEQVIKVKVIPGTVTNGSGTFVKLSMLNIDQATGEFIQPPLTKHQKEPLKPREGLKNVASEHDLPTNTGNGEGIPSSHAQPHISQENRVDVEDQSAITVEERHGEAPQASVERDTNAKSDSDVEITGSFERAEARDNRSTPEPRFGLGFTNTPRKRKKRATSVEGADSPALPAAASVASGQERRSMELKDAPVVDARRNRHEDRREVTKPQSGPTPISSAVQSKKVSTKSHSKAKLGKKQLMVENSVQTTPAGAKQDNVLPQGDSNMSSNQSEPLLGGNTSLLTAPLPTAKTSGEPEEYLAFPPTMTREQYLAQKEANAAAIARRNAAAGGKAGDVKSSGPAEAQIGNQSKKPTAKKHKDKPVEGGRLSAAFETPPPAVHIAHRKTSEDKEHSIPHTSHDATPKSPNYEKKHSKNDRDSKGRQQSEHDGALSTKPTDTSKSQEVGLASTEASALECQAKTTPTSSRSPPSTPTKASNTTLPRTTVNPPPKSEAKATNPKPGLAKPLTASRTQVQMPFNSKALSMAELKARKEAAKKSAKASSSLLTPHSSALATSALQTVLALGSESDESDSGSDSESSSEGADKQKTGAALMKRKAFQRPLSRPDPTIRDRSMSIDIDNDDDSD